ncbi:MAG: IS4 family transposase, partial [Candidatus Omnitrophica bacterium]|nr:IS4 family transposase [Candidatus Omnitrophota bacterium]
MNPLFVMWFLVSMSLQRFVSIPNVMVGLMVGLRGRFHGLPLRPTTDGAITHDRRRLGVAPLVKWFQWLADSIQGKPMFHGLCVWIVDGTTLSLPDTAKNEAVFGKRKASRGKTAFPRLKLTGLLEGYSRRMKTVRIFPDRHSELRGFRTLIEGLAEGDLLLGDRHFHSFTLAADLMRRKVDFLFRIPKNMKIKVEKILGRGDFVGALTYRCHHEDLVGLPNVEILSKGPRKTKVRLLVRVLDYQLEGGESSRLITSLVDPIEYESMELVLLYHRRWDVELAY